MHSKLKSDDLVTVSHQRFTLSVINLYTYLYSFFVETTVPYHPVLEIYPFSAAFNTMKA